MSKFTYKRLAYEFPFDLDDSRSFDHVKVLECLEPGGEETVLFVLDYVPTEDLKSGQILSGANKAVLMNMLKYSRHFYKHKPFNWYATSFHACKTIGLPRSFAERAFDAFRDRLLHIIDLVDPSKVVFFGKHQFEMMCPEEWAKCNGNSKPYIGVPITKTYTLPSGRKWKGQVTRLPSIDKAIHGVGVEDCALLGYTSRGLANALYGDILYRAELPEFKIHLVDTIEKFDRLMEILYRSPVVSIDTEDDNLNKLVNRVLTIQFAVSLTRAWVLPVHHKDSPFTSKEIRYICDRLRTYFETSNNEYQIFVNAKFDLGVMKTQFGVRFFKSPVWDIQAGEYVHDENLKAVQSVDGGGKKGGSSYYGLANVSCQYGLFAYMEAKFSKSDRATIGSVDLTDDVLYYMALDVIVPFSIHLQQKRRAVDLGYTKYDSMVKEQMSDVTHSLALLEYNGYKIDIAYLFKMKLPNSPINAEIDRLKHTLSNSEGALKANAILCRAKGMPKTGLFGTPNIFRPSMELHKQVLFIDVLGLEAISTGAKGQANIDKAFQKANMHVPEVKMYADLQKAEKLRNSYVKQILRFWGEQADFKKDMRIRCSFDYLRVVTGRTSAEKPGLQQIPTHSEMSKHIKRMFIAEKGTVILKVDYSAHEVRGWGIISKDAEVARAFEPAHRIVAQLKRCPSEELLYKLDFEGDVHRVNASYFFNVNMSTIAKDMAKELRQRIKSVVFGLIYGKATTTLSKDLKLELSDTESLVDQFMQRFVNGTKWFDFIEKHAQKHYFVESPIGRRRYLFGYMLPNTTKWGRRIWSAMNRRARNSPVQGFGSDCMMVGIRVLQEKIWDHFQRTGYLPKIKPCVSVHDSLECEVAYEDLLLAIRLVEDSLTNGVKARFKERHGLDLNSDLMIDFEIGPCGSHLTKWHYEVDKLKQIVKDSLKFQAAELGYEQDSKALYRSVFNSPTSKYKPKWMKEQIKMAA